MRWRIWMDKNGNGGAEPIPPMDGCTGCGLVLVGIIAIPSMILLLLKLLSKIPVIGEVFRLFYELVSYSCKLFLIELPIRLVKVVINAFINNIPPIGLAILIAIIVLPIIIGIGIWIKHKIDEM